MGNFLSRQVTEMFVTQNPLRPQRPPLTGQEGLQALSRAEAIDQYRALVAASSINRNARAGQNYLPSLVSISRSVPPAPPSQPWPSGQVIWMEPTADNGLPHTRPPYYICISKDFPQEQLENTLLHERVHVHQRMFPEFWKSLLSETWEFTPWSGSIPQEIQARLRINPDILGAPLFVWKKIWLPLAIFKSTSHPKLNQIDIIWWNIESRTIHREPPPNWISFFGNLSAGEHPYEIAAYLIAENPSQNKAFLAIKSRLFTAPSGENI